MSRRSVAEWLSDIVYWGERLQDHLKDIDRDTFLVSPVLQDAASKCAEAIGEAAGKLDDAEPGLNDAFPDLNLKLARRSRDRLSHGYYHIDIEILGIPSRLRFQRRWLPRDWQEAAMPVEPDGGKADRGTANRDFMIPRLQRCMAELAEAPPGLKADSADWAAPKLTRRLSLRLSATSRGR
jgi:uncharacterized protein with HEPN domain